MRSFLALLCLSVLVAFLLPRGQAFDFTIRSRLNDRQLRGILHRHGFEVYGRPEYDPRLVHIKQVRYVTDTPTHHRHLRLLERMSARRLFNQVEYQHPQFNLEKRTISHMELRSFYDKRHLLVKDDTHRFNDPHSHSWQFLDSRNTTHPQDANVVPIWDRNITGRGVTVTVLDDGIDNLHADLVANYCGDISINMCSPETQGLNPRGPNKDMLTEDFHGTLIAGVIAAQANNKVCSHGIAYNARVGAVRMFCKSPTDILMARSASYHSASIDIINCSWGPRDDGETSGGPGKHILSAIDHAIERGRHEKGTLFVFAVGNGAMEGDNCGADGYVNHPRVIAVGALSASGKLAGYSEKCSAVRILAPVNSYSTGLPSTRQNNGCGEDFSGTSAAAPFIIGCIALALEANPEVSWRDVMHMISLSGRMPNPHNYKYAAQLNGAGLVTSSVIGSGLIDCSLLVNLAKEWHMVGPLYQVKIAHTKLSQAEDYWIEFDELSDGQTLKSRYSNQLPIRRHMRLSYTIEPPGPLGRIIFPKNATNTSEEAKIAILENVLVRLTIEHSRMGDVSVWLTSPAGTVTDFLYPRHKDKRNTTVNYAWTSPAFYGERAAGKWTLHVRDTGLTNANQSHGYVLAVSLVFEGTTVQDSAQARNAQLYDTVLTEDGKKAREQGRAKALVDDTLERVYEEQLARFNKASLD